MSTVIWVDASAGASGDMLLGALLGAGVPVEVMQRAIDAVSPEPVTLRVERVRRGDLAATRCHVEVADSAHHRTWSEVEQLIIDARLEAVVEHLATLAFDRLARAEARVHGGIPRDVHFHEVGALDAIADVVGVCAGFAHLGGRVVVSPVAVGSGWAHGAHGALPVPPPAVAELLHGVPSYAGPPGAPDLELCTPTAAALLTTLANEWGPQPAIATTAVGVGAGGRDPDGYANVTRIFVGAAPGSVDGPTMVATEQQVLVECNVDDLDPRVWPAVLDALLAAGAVDAWLTPILMKKGRPAHTLGVLAPAAAVPGVHEVVFTHTSSIGLRQSTVSKHALDRELGMVEVDGHPIGVKLARLGGSVVNAQPEYDDVARAATALGRPVTDVLAAAQAEARRLLG